MILFLIKTSQAPLPTAIAQHNLREFCTNSPLPQHERSEKWLHECAVCR